MKKFLIASMVLALAVAVLPSCKKKYKCECINHSQTDGSEYVIENPYQKKLNKAQANAKKSECEATPDCTFLRDKGK